LRSSSFDVVTTVRSEEKGDRILAAHPNTPNEKLSYVIVKDIAEDGAFDEVCFPHDWLSHAASRLYVLRSQPSFGAGH
jgi:hypothetical protein